MAVLRIAKMGNPALMRKAAPVADPTAPENLMLSYGRGLMLIHTFMDEVAFNERGNEITMVQRKSDR